MEKMYQEAPSPIKQAFPVSQKSIVKQTLDAFH